VHARVVLAFPPRNLLRWRASRDSPAKILGEGSQGAHFKKEELLERKVLQYLVRYFTCSHTEFNFSARFMRRKYKIRTRKFFRFSQLVGDLGVVDMPIEMIHSPSL
jgi:hypothetical protein